jgi:hypothetical protein
MFKSLAAMNAFEAVHLATLSHGFGAPVDGAAFARSVLLVHEAGQYADLR